MVTMELELLGYGRHTPFNTTVRLVRMRFDNRVQDPSAQGELQTTFDFDKGVH